MGLLARTARYVALIAVGTLVLGFATKAPCLAPWHQSAVPQACYTDVQQLFLSRHLQLHLFPYIHGSYIVSPTGSVFLSHGNVEYPIVTGLVMWATALPVSSADGYLISNAVVLGFAGVLTAWGLSRLAGRRAVMFAAAPILVLYGFINWDLASVALTVAGIFLWSRDRRRWAAVLFALGACTKLWPGLMLVPLVSEMVWLRRKKEAMLVAGAAALTLVGLNVPFMVANWRGWYAPFAFQRWARFSAPGSSVWTWDLKFVNSGTATEASLLLTAIGVAVIGVVGWRMAMASGSYPLLQVGAALVFLYLILSKNNSPQYELWVLPFCVCLRLRPSIWVQLNVVGALMYGFFLHVITEGPVLDLIGAWQTAIFIVGMIVALRSDDVIGPVTTALQLHGERATCVGLASA